MSKRVSEEYQLLNETFTISSATTWLTEGVSLHDGEQVTFLVGMGTAAAASTAITPTITARQSGDRALSTSTTISGISTLLGPTTAEALSNVKQARITMTTAATGAQTVQVNGTTWTFSTAPAATAFTFGSSVGSSNAEGLETAMNSLSSVINASTAAALQGLTASTNTTAAVVFVANNTASTDVNLTGVAGAYGVTSEKAQLMISVKAEDLNSTSQYVGIGVSSATTSVPMSVTIIKKGTRYKPPFQIGAEIKST